MKKSLAALGASILGLGVATAGAAPAMAEPAPLEPCTDFGEQISSIDLGEEWFQECVPQYGLSKTEFTIVADENNPSVDFPSDFAPLDDISEEDSPIQVTSTIDSAAITEYFNPTGEGGTALAPVLPIAQLDDSVGSQTYVALTIAPVASAGPATPETTPDDVLAACDLEGWTTETPDIAGWVATYDPIDTTFTQTAGGSTWAYTVTAQSKPTYFFLFADDGITGACVTDGDTAITLSDDSLQLYYLFVLASPFLPEDLDGWIIPPTPTSAEEMFESLTDRATAAAFGESGLYDLGTFARDAVTPQLAATGSDGSALLVPALIGGGVLIVGGALVVITLVRRRRATEAAGEPEKTTPTE